MTPTTPDLDREARRARLTGLPSLTGLRFFAAMAVFLYHVTSPQLSPFTGSGAKRAGWLFGSAGGVGVSFFFILSGFILTWSARPGDTPRRFMRRRLVKLYPNHLVTFALSMALFAGATATSRQWLPNLFLVQAWFSDPSVSFSVNAPSWSLACELVFYLSFPLLHRWTRKINPAHLWGWVAALVALVVAVPAFAYAVLTDSPRIPGWPASPVQNWFVYQLPPVRLLEFAIGMLLALIVLNDRWIGLRMHHALGLFAAGYVVALNVPYLYGLTAACVVPLALVVPAVAVADLQGRPSPLRGRVMVRLGELSFAFYLMQAVVLVGGTRLLGAHQPYSTTTGLALSLLAFAVILTLAQLLHVCVEAPAMKRWSKPRGTATPAPVPSPEPAAAPSATPADAAREQQLTSAGTGLPKN